MLTVGQQSRDRIRRARTRTEHRATGRELRHPAELVRADHTGDLVPQLPNTVVINGIDQEVDRFLSGVPDTIPSPPDRLLSGLERHLHRGDAFLDLVERRLDATGPNPVDVTRNPVPHRFDDLVLEPIERGRKRSLNKGDHEHEQALGARPPILDMSGNPVEREFDLVPQPLEPIREELHSGDGQVPCGLDLAPQPHRTSSDQVKRWLDVVGPHLLEPVTQPFDADDNAVP